MCFVESKIDRDVLKRQKCTAAKSCLLQHFLDFHLSVAGALRMSLQRNIQFDDLIAALAPSGARTRTRTTGKCKTGVRGRGKYKCWTHTALLRASCLGKLCVSVGLAFL